MIIKLNINPLSSVSVIADLKKIASKINGVTQPIPKIISTKPIPK